jgi:hypothetical protein
VIAEHIGCRILECINNPKIHCKLYFARWYEKSLCSRCTCLTGLRHGNPPRFDFNDNCGKDSTLVSTIKDYWNFKALDIFLERQGSRGYNFLFKFRFVGLKARQEERKSRRHTQSSSWYCFHTLLMDMMFFFPWAQTLWFN